MTDRLIPLFAIGAFLAFTLSQAGMVAHWRREGGPRAGLNIAINATGAVATGITVVLVLAAKFVEGAWITVLLVPALILLMRAVHRHYERVKKVTRVGALDFRPAGKMIAVVPVSRWDRPAEHAMRFACSLTEDVRVLHVDCSGEEGEASCEDWTPMIEEAARRAGVKAPEVTTVASPFRFITGPILRHVQAVEAANEGRPIGVVVPELVARRWYQYLLHNHRSTALKAALLIRGNGRIVVINVPWYLDGGRPETALAG